MLIINLEDCSIEKKTLSLAYHLFLCHRVVELDWDLNLDLIGMNDGGGMLTSVKLKTKRDELRFQMQEFLFFARRRFMVINKIFALLKLLPFYLRDLLELFPNIIFDKLT